MVTPECRVIGFGVNQAKYPVFRLAALSNCDCAYAEVCDVGGVALPGHTMPPLINALQEEGTVSPIAP